MNIKKIGQFLKSVDGAEYLFMRHCMGMRDNIQELIKRHKLTKNDVCERFNIKPSQYKNFIMGNFNYDMGHMARLNSSFIELESKKLEKKVPVKIAGEDALL